MPGPAADELGIYTVCDARYFPALVLLIASVERNAPGATLTVFDVGLDDDQRTWLGDRARVVDGRAGRRATPTLHKAFAATLDATGTILIIDADGLVAGDLAPLVARARAGRILAAVDPQADRRVEEWATMFGLRVPLREQPYVAAGTVLLDADVHGDLLRRWWDLCGVASDHFTEWRADPRRPLALLDQDVLNALLMSEVPAGTVEHLGADEVVASVFMPGVRLRDADRLTFTARRRPPPLVLQCLAAAKPFLPEAATQLYGSAYAVATRAVLTREARRAAPGSALSADRLVPWMRPGPLGAWRFRRRTVRIRVRKTLGRWRARWLPHR